MPVFERFLVSNGSKASRSHPKLKVLNFAVSSGSIEAPRQPGGVLIVKIYAI